jgi:hypothetical protein
MLIDWFYVFSKNKGILERKMTKIVASQQRNVYSGGAEHLQSKD